jgi:hypothetical protein
VPVARIVGAEYTVKRTGEDEAPGGCQHRGPRGPFRRSTIAHVYRGRRRGTNSCMISLLIVATLGTGVMSSVHKPKQAELISGDMPCRSTSRVVVSLQTP